MLTIISIVSCSRIKYVFRNHILLTLAMTNAVFFYFYSDDMTIFCWDEMFRCALGDNLNAIIINILIQLSLWIRSSSNN